MIGGIGYGSHYFVFRQHMSQKDQLWFEFYLTMVWISYIIAILKDPGRPEKGFQPVEGEWKRWCKKCKNYKPERSHHCKVCKTCVLKMDHHCPWTYNCVGHDNLPHFLRFLVWVIFTTGYVLVQLIKRAMAYYRDSDLPSYLIDKKEMVAVILFIPLDLFVMVSVFILFLRCFINISFKGMSQIEVWEEERIESQLHKESIWLQIRKNYFNLHGKDMPELKSWNQDARYFEQEESDPREGDDDLQSIVPKNFTMDDMIFPYDLGFWKNTVNACGYPWMWLIPWGGPNTDGHHYEKSEYMEDDQLGLPWPPDGGHQEFVEEEEVDLNNIELSDLKTLRKRLDPRANMKRSEWLNDLGESLGDFGVDLDAEDVEHDVLLPSR